MPLGRLRRVTERFILTYIPTFGGILLALTLTPEAIHTVEATVDDAVTAVEVIEGAAEASNLRISLTPGEVVVGAVTAAGIALIFAADKLIRELSTRTDQL